VGDSAVHSNVEADGVVILVSLNQWGDGEAGPKRAQWAFVADFGEYAGNFPDDFAAWVIGRADEGLEDRVEELLKLARQQIPNAEEMMNDLLGCRIDEKRGYTHHSIAPTPGRRNNGMGEHADASSGYPCAAYESVAIFLDRKPTDEELALLVSRAKTFHEAPRSSRFDHRPKVLRCRLVKEVTTLELIDVG